MTRRDALWHGIGFSLGRGLGLFWCFQGLWLALFCCRLLFRDHGLADSIRISLPWLAAAAVSLAAASFLLISERLRVGLAIGITSLATISILRLVHAEGAFSSSPRFGVASVLAAAHLLAWVLLPTSAGSLANARPHASIRR